MVVFRGIGNQRTIEKTGLLFEIVCVLSDTAVSSRRPVQVFVYGVPVYDLGESQ